MSHRKLDLMRFNELLRKELRIPHIVGVERIFTGEISSVSIVMKNPGVSNVQGYEDRVTVLGERFSLRHKSTDINRNLTVKLTI